MSPSRSSSLLLPFKLSFSAALILAMAAALYSATLCSSYILNKGNKRSHHSQLPAKDNFEELLSTIQHELFAHSSSKDVSKESPCQEITDKNATMIKSIGRTTQTLVEVDQSARFHISYCSAASEAGNFCAVDSTCATIYRWKKAPVRQEIVAGSGFQLMMDDEILVPSGCTCVIGSLTNSKGGKPNLPIIIF